MPPDASTTLVEAALPAAPNRARRGALERLPKWLICVPLTVQWLWLAARYRSATLPSCANPAIPSGGLVGEGKLDYFKGMGPLARAATAPWCALTPDVRADMAQVREAMAAAGLGYPVVAKPDLGMCGFGVRRIDDEPGLAAYFAAFPPAETLLLQRWLPWRGEAGIFYARHPDQRQGRITGLALRHFPEVVGDGRSTIAELMAAEPRTAKLLERRDHDFTPNPASVPAAGQAVRLSAIGSTRIGGLYLNGARLITPALEAAIDAVARDMPDFHFGRFDLRFEHEAELMAGRGFSIMEVNGAGSEAIEAWDPATRLWPALKTIFDKQSLLFEIGAANRARGHAPMTLMELTRQHLRQQNLLDRYPPSN